MKRILNWSNNHRIYSVIILIAIIGIGYWSYKKIFPAVVVPQYTLSMVKTGSITQTVTGTGQVSASNQTDIQSQVSGTIETINVSVGQAVHAGDLIATIDSSNAAISLQNAKLSLAKLVEPVKQTDMSNAQSTLMKAYDSGFNTVSSTFLDLPTIMSGLKDLLYSRDGFLSDQNSSYLITSGKAYRDAAGQAYDLAYNQYQTTLLEYKSLSRNSATSSIDTLIADTYTTIKDVANAATSAHNSVNNVITTQPDYQKTSANSALNNTSTWSNQANADVSSIVSTQSSILSASNSMTTLLAGTDSLDIQSAQLSLEQAQRTYNNYFIKAPYDGIIGRIPVNVYGQAGSATTIATIVGQQKMASISLNEVDAAKVKAGQTVNITFDAIDGLNATGTVSSIDQIGTVSSGVVSYGVKILINTADDRIKPGMSVNTTIITLQKDNVLVVPTAAVKKQGTESYVQTFDLATVRSIETGDSTATGQTPPSSSNGISSTSPSSARTGNESATASSTKSYSGSSSSSRLVTISTSILPTQTNITTGDSDDTNIEITSGVTRGTFVVTKTTTTASSKTTTAPSILSSLTGSRTTRTNTTTPTSGSSKTAAPAASGGMNAGGPPQGM